VVVLLLGFWSRDPYTYLNNHAYTFVCGNFRCIIPRCVAFPRVWCSWFFPILIVYLPRYCYRELLLSNAAKHLPTFNNLNSTSHDTSPRRTRQHPSIHQHYPTSKPISFAQWPTTPPVETRCTMSYASSCIDVRTHHSIKSRCTAASWMH
jgi:hypothetical protein